MTSEEFQRGFEIQPYIDNLRNYRSFVRQLMGEAEASRQHIEAVKTASAQHPQPVRASIMSEDWCGDSACNLPILASLFGGAGVCVAVS